MNDNIVKLLRIMPNCLERVHCSTNIKSNVDVFDIGLVR